MNFYTFAMTIFSHIDQDAEAQPFVAADAHEAARR